MHGDDMAMLAWQTKCVHKLYIIMHGDDKPNVCINYTSLCSHGDDKPNVCINYTSLCMAMTNQMCA